MPSFDIGNLGPRQGEPVTYFWNPIYNASCLLPWLFVAAGFVFFKENRNRSSLLILVPVLIAFVLWIIYCKTVSVSAAEKLQYDIVFTSLIAGSTLSCLLSSRLDRIHGLLSLILLTGLFSLIYALHLYLNLGFNSTRVEFGIMYFAITLMTVIPSFILAGSFCRKRCSFVRFISFYSAGLAVLAAISNLLILSTYYLAWYSVMLPIGSFLKLWLETFLLCFSISIPYLILMFTNSHWRTRFEKLLKIQTMLAIENQIKTSEQPVTE